MEYSTNFEPGSYQSACETYINFIDFIDEMDSYIATEADGGDKLPWYKKLLNAVTNLITRVQTKIQTFIIDILEKSGKIHTVTDEGVKLIGLIIKKVKFNNKLLKNIDFVNYPDNANMTIEKVKKAKAEIEEEIKKVFDKEAIKKGKESLNGASMERKYDANKLLSQVRVDVNTALTELKGTVADVTKNAENYNEKSKAAATSACSACISLISLIDKYIPQVITKLSVRIDKIKDKKEEGKAEIRPVNA